ncbi:MAG: hypothetical protein CMQ38_11980 [Gammaproteobacteria bacterium]|nr:hypothetical protein [Gammaproteobacteria bacterium]
MLLLAACSPDTDNTGQLESLEAELEMAREEIASLSEELNSLRDQAAQEEETKRVVSGFFEPGADMLDLLHEGYVQHNPVFKRFGEINGVSGKDEARLLFSFFMPQGDEESMEEMPAPDPNQPVGDPTYLVLAEGDVGVALQQRWLPDPMNEGEYYEAFWFDAWRVRDGQLYEHWDAAVIEEPLPPFLQEGMGEAAVEQALGQ